jgi:hypothetical protein
MFFYVVEVVMAKNLRNHKMIFVVRPALLLQLFFVCVLISFAFFVWWEVSGYEHWTVFGMNCAPELEVRDWLFVMGLMFAIAGWVCSALITFRNSVKQHTVGVYVQSRLSSPYAEISRRVNLKHFSMGSLVGPIPQSYFTNKNNAEDMYDINTILNYFEFIAVGIRQGDLDESILKNTMRGMISNMCAKTSLYVAYIRTGRGSVGTARTFEHLLWLNDRWTLN